MQLGQGEETAVVPIVHYGFPWPADSFQWISPPPQELPELLACRYSRPGCGVPLVVHRGRNPHDPAEVRFFAPQSTFAATVLLRFSDASNDRRSADSFDSAVLEFHDPLRAPRVSLPEGNLPLAGDLTAPLAKTLQTSPRTYLSGFVQPGAQDEPSKLGFLEPYQKGKPPVVLIHGLFSDPQSWADLVNDLRAIPGFCDRFQIWYFRYPTGQGFLRSAAELRQELQVAIQSCDPQRTDPALQEMILVGHSMGGLIAKLQVTHSDDTIWRRLANRPFEEIRADNEDRMRLAAACFFQPAPHVRRVIFIATPHEGSNDASGLVGNVATLLVRQPPEEAQTHRRLLEQNPGVFTDIVQKRLPTSIDLLKPDSPLLDAMREMRIGDGIELHTIIGVTFHPSLHGPSDGVVPVASAKHPGSLSETWTQSPHSKVHRAAETTKEVARILAEHCVKE
ncbi:MAG: alpha/beta fold hydrolase [Pirellulaceae bacterium]|nr:alpha/beta fold hydrolase [Pirellulaceae bacterium]